MTEEPSIPPAPSRRKSRLLMIFIAFALGVPAGFVFAHAVRVPAVKSLEEYQPAIITRVFDRNGIPFAEYAIQRRIVVPRSEMSPFLVNAIIATEDADFYKHGGISPKAVIRAGIKDLLAGRKVEGASTLTQQLAKLIFLTPEKSWRRKFSEAMLAIQIEKDFTKDQILELYANQVYFGHGAYGVEAASRLYFGKHAKDLTLPEAAMIAGISNRPGSYSPILNPDNARKRRDHVLRRMLEVKYIDRAQFQQAINTPVVLGTYKEGAPNVGAYFAEDIRQSIENNPKFGVEDLYRGGLKVFSTLDLRMQQIAESALQRGLRRFDHWRGFRRPSRNVIAEGVDPASYKDPSWTNEAVILDKLYPAVVMNVETEHVFVRVGKDEIDLMPPSFAWTGRKTMFGALKRGDLVYVRWSEDSKTKEKKWYYDQMPQVQGAVVILDVKTGDIRALVGGYDFAISKFNRATQSRRQTGSSFKPYVYGAAFEKGFTAGDTLFDAPVEIPVGKDIYAPKNYYGRYSGIVTIQRATELSINIPAVKTLMIIGADAVADFTRRCGITSDLPKYPSLALGAAGVSPLEMTAGYNVFVNHGVYVKPRRIARITDQTDRILEEPPSELSEATSPQVAFELAYMLKGTIQRGTAYAAHTLPGPLAGKTGTTNGYTDAWFMGFSPEYTVGVWIGYDDPGRTLGGGATGAEVALPIWIDIFKQMDAQKMRTAKPEFEQPPGVVIVPMDLKTGRRGVGPCSRVVMEAFVAGQEPDKDCSGTDVEVTKLPYYLQRPFYQPKDAEPTQTAVDASARSGEGGESAAPGVNETAPGDQPTTPPPAPPPSVPPAPPPPASVPPAPAPATTTSPTTTITGYQ